MSNNPDWTDVRYFLEVARTGKLSVAAMRLSVEHSTVSRRIARLEEQLGVVLFDRRRSGYFLTDAGRALMPRAELMESVLAEAMDESSAGAAKLMGTVRVGTPEAFGVCVVSPRLTRLQQLHPELHVELMAQPQFPNLVTREVDLLVTLDPPQAGRYRVTRLTDIHYYLYASATYLAGHPPIRELSDLVEHDFIDYVHDGAISERFRYLEEVTANPRRSFSCTSILAQREAALAGIGLVLLTPYVAGNRGELVKLFTSEPQVIRTLWLATPEDLFKVRRVRVIWDFIRNLVESEPQLFQS
jgi:DNA-binding transcriptional LysR family regulator